MQRDKEILEHTALNGLIPSNPSPRSSENPVEELGAEMLEPPRKAVTRRTRPSNQMSQAYMTQQAQSLYRPAPDPEGLMV